MRPVFNTLGRFVEKPRRGGMLNSGNGQPTPSLLYDFLVSPNPIIGGGTTTTTISANGTHVNSAGLITQNTSNVWPLDHDPATGVEGSELVSNPTLATNANGWTATGAATIVSSGGRGLGTINNAFEAIGTTVTGLTVGQRYRFSGTIERGTITSVTATLTGIADVVAITGSGPQNFTYDFVAISTTQFAGFYSGVTGTFFIDLTSVKPVTYTSRGRPIWEARTNLVAYSSALDNAAWVKTFSAVSNNATASPDGTTNADKIVEDSSTNLHFIDDGVTLADTTNYVTSTFVKNAGRGFAAAGLVGRAGVFSGGYWDLATGVFSNQINAGTGFNAEQFGSGWWRTQFVQNSDVGAATTAIQVYTASAAGTATYLGNGADGIFNWGNQVEAGAFATPYIPTAGAAVTRAADAASIAFNPGAQGTFVWEGIAFTATTNAVDQVLVELGDGTANERIVVKRNATTGTVTLDVIDGGASQASITTANAMAANTVSRVAIAFAANNFALCLNGGTIVTDSSGTMPTLTTIYHGSAYDGSLHLNGWERKLAFYPQRFINDRLPNLYP